MKHKLLCVLLCISMLIPSVPIEVQAEKENTCTHGTVQESQSVSQKDFCEICKAESEEETSSAKEEKKEEAASEEEKKEEAASIEEGKKEEAASIEEEKKEDAASIEEKKEEAASEEEKKEDAASIEEKKEEAASIEEKKEDAASIEEGKKEEAASEEEVKKEETDSENMSSEKTEDKKESSEKKGTLEVKEEKAEEESQTTGENRTVSENQTVSENDFQGKKASYSLKAEKKSGYTVTYNADATTSSTVYVSAKGNDSYTGSSSNQPMKSWVKALKKVSAGGTIVIVDEGGPTRATDNDLLQLGDIAVVIDKPVTIEGMKTQGTGRATFETDCAGIVLGANVTFKNLEFLQRNPVRNVIVANGYHLTLDSVASTTTSPVTVFAGAIVQPQYNKYPASGSNASIIVKGTGNKLDNIYAGNFSDLGAYNNGQRPHVNSPFGGNVSIKIENGTTGKVGNIYAFGGRERREGDGTSGMWQGIESYFPINGSIKIETYESVADNVLGAVGNKKAHVVVNSVNKVDGMTISGISTLEISGNLTPSEYTDTNIDIILNSGAELDLEKVVAGSSYTINNLTGTTTGGKPGILSFPEQSTLVVQGTFQGRVELQTTKNRPTDKSTSGLVDDGWSYIECKSANADQVKFTPYTFQPKAKLEYKDGAWTASLGTQQVDKKPDSFAISSGHEEQTVSKTKINTQGINIPVEVELGADLPFASDIPMKIKVHYGSQTWSGKLVPDEGYTYCVEYARMGMYITESSGVDVIWLGKCYYDAYDDHKHGDIAAGSYRIEIEVDTNKGKVTRTIMLTVEDDQAQPKDAVLNPSQTPDNGWYKELYLVSPSGYKISLTKTGSFLDQVKVPEGNHGSLEYWLQPTSGGTAVKKEFTQIKVDATAPILSQPQITEVTNSGAKILVEARDDLSLVEESSYRLIQTAPVDKVAVIGQFQKETTGGNFLLSDMEAGQNYTFKLTVSDKAGNISEKTFDVSIDKASIGNGQLSLKSGVSFIYDGSEQRPGIDQLQLQLNGRTIQLSSTHFTVSYSNNVEAGGNAQITLKATDTNPNYTGTVSGVFTIAKRNAAITASAQTIRKGGRISTEVSRISSSGLVIGHQVQSITLTGDEDTKKIMASGAKIVKASDSSIVTNNYNITYHQGDLRVVDPQIALTVKENIVYDGHPLTVVANGGAGDVSYTLTDCKNVSYKWYDSQGTSVIEAPQEAGSYILKVTASPIEVGGTITREVRVTIKPLPIQIGWSDHTNRSYGDGKTVTAAVMNPQNGDKLTLMVSGGNRTEVGRHTATATMIGGSKANNYTLSGVVTTVDYEIAKAASVQNVKAERNVKWSQKGGQIFTIDDFTLPEGIKNPAFTKVTKEGTKTTDPQGIFGNSPVLEKSKITFTLVNPSVYQEGGKGVYEVNISSDTHLDLTATITISIVDKEVVDQDLALEMKDITYGEKPNPQGSYPNAQTGSRTEKYTYSKDGGQYENLENLVNDSGFLPAGDYSVRYQYLDNDRIGTRVAAFNVAKKPLKVVFDVSSLTKEYDKTNELPKNQIPTLEVSGAVGKENPELEVKGVTFKYEDGQAGNGKLITAMGIALMGGNDVNKNYEVSETASSTGAAITPKEVSIKPREAYTKNYGAADPSFDYVVTGLVQDDALQGSLMRKPGEEVGTYGWDVSALKNSNYRVRVGADSSLFEITKAEAEIFITANVVSQKPGGEVVLTVTARNKNPLEAKNTVQPKAVEVEGVNFTAKAEGVFEGRYTIPASAKAGETLVLTVRVKDSNYLSEKEEKIKVNVSENEVTTLPAPEELNNKSYRMEIELGISKVPEGLKNHGSLGTVEKILSALKTEIRKLDANIADGNMVTYDITLWYSADQGASWTKADTAHWPKEGVITILLPYPEKTAAATHNFKVSHLFTEDMNGNKAGTFEYPTVSKKAEGLEFKVSGLSPVIIGWSEIKEKPVSPSQDGNTNQGGNGGQGGGSSQGGGTSQGGSAGQAGSSAKPNQGATVTAQTPAPISNTITSTNDQSRSTGITAIGMNAEGKAKTTSRERENIKTNGVAESNKEQQTAKVEENGQIITGGRKEAEPAEIVEEKQNQEILPKESKEVSLEEEKGSSLVLWTAIIAVVVITSGVIVFWLKRKGDRT